VQHRELVEGQQADGPVSFAVLRKEAELWGEWQSSERGSWVADGAQPVAGRAFDLGHGDEDMSAVYYAASTSASARL
jgi:hypothetical protein